MIRGMTLLWAALALIVSVGLFLLKYEVGTLEDRLAGLNRDIYQNQQTIHVLKAEWSYLNDPDRLRELNDRHLGLTTVAPARVAQIDTLPIDDGTPEDDSRTMAATTPKAEAAKAAAPAKRAPATETRPPATPRPPAGFASARPPTTPVAAPPAAMRPRPVPPALPVAAPALSQTLPAERRPNVTVIKSQALLDAEASGWRPQ